MEEEMQLSLERQKIQDNLAKLQTDIKVRAQQSIQLDLNHELLNKHHQEFQPKLGEFGQWIRLAMAMAQRDEILEQKTTSEDSEQAKQQEDDIEKLQERLAKMRIEYQQMELTEQNKAKILGQHEQQNDFRIRLEKESIKRQERQEELMNHLEMVNKRIMEVQMAKARKYAAYKNKTQQLKYAAQQKDREIKKLRQTIRRQTIYEPSSTSRHLPTIASVPTDEEEEENDDEDRTFDGSYLQKMHCHSAVGHTGSILSLHATEVKMISGSKDRSAKVWDLSSGEHLITLGNHPNNVNFVHLLPDGHTALTSSLNLVKVWDLRTHRCTHHLNSMGIANEGLNTPCNRITAMHETDIRVQNSRPASGRTDGIGTLHWTGGRKKRRRKKTERDGKNKKRPK